MVQYIVTPWRNHEELISVREHLYPGGGQPPSSSSSSSTSGDLSDSLPWSAVYATASSTTAGVSRAEADQRLAVGRVQMWAHRGNCPHLVESTGLLVAVVLDDVDQSRRRRSGQLSASSSSLSSSLSLSDFAVRAAYATAFSRYVSCFPCCFAYAWAAACTHHSDRGFVFRDFLVFETNTLNGHPSN